MAGKMKIWFLPLGAVLALTACGDSDGDSWRDAANTYNDAQCTKIYACLSAQELENMRLAQPNIGSSEAECIENYRQAIASRSEPPCPTDWTFFPERAEQCAVDLEAQTCDDYKVEWPDSCTTVCEAN